MTELVFAKGHGGGGPDNDPDNLYSGDAFELVLGIAEGEIEGIKGTTTAQQLNNVFLDGTPILGLTGEKNFRESQLMACYERGSLATILEEPDGQSPIPYVLSGPASPISVGASLQPQVAVTRTIPSSYRNKYHRLEIRILVSRLVSIKDDGAKSLNVTVRIRYKKASAELWTTKFEKISGKTMSGGFVRSFIFALYDTSEDYVVELMQLEDSNPEGDVRDLVWTTMEVSEPKGANRQFIEEYHAGTAMMSVVAKVGENFNRLPNVTAVWRGLLCSIPSNYDPETRLYDEATPWNGSFKPQKYWTNNPFWIARELIINPRFGMARYNPTVSVDDYSLYEEAKYADTLREVTLANGKKAQIPLFTFNAVLSDPMNGLELINYILSSANAQAVEYSSGYIRIISDRNTPSIMTIVPEMCVQQHEDVVFTYSASDLKERFNEVTVTYIDPDLDWQTQFLGPFVDSEAQEIQGVNATEFNAIGCTNPHEAKYKGYFRLIAAQTETLSVSFVVPAYALEWDIGDIVDIVDPMMDWGLSGRARSIVGTQLNLRTPLYLEQAGTYNIEIQTRNNGKVVRTFYVQVAGTYNKLTLNGQIQEPLADYPAFWITSSTAAPGQAKPFRIVAIKPVEGQPYQYSISAIEVNRSKWSQALSMELGDAPEYSFEGLKKLPAPTNLRFVKESSLATTIGSQDIVSLTWDIAQETYIGLSFTLQHSKDGGPFTDVEITRLNFLDVTVELGINYVFRVKQNYLGEELFSNTLEYTIQKVKPDELAPSRLTIDISGQFVENNLKLSIKPMYRFDLSLPPVDLIKSEKVTGLNVAFFGLEVSGQETLIWNEIYTTGEIELTEAQQYQSKARLYREIRAKVQLMDQSSMVFPATPVEYSVSMGSEIQILNIKADTSALTISAEATLSTPLRRGQTLRWFIGSTPDGSDRYEIAEGTQLYAYPVNQPDTQFYMWARLSGSFGVSNFYPAGLGLPVKTLKMEGDPLGLQATTYWITRSASAIKKQNESYDTPQITLEAFSQTGGGDVKPYLGIFKVTVLNNNGLWSDFYQSSVAESQLVITVPSGIKTLNYKLLSAEDLTKKLDEENTVIVEDGVTYDLKIVSSNGTIFRVNEARTTMLIAKVFRNGVEVTADIPASKFKWTRVSVNPKPAPNDDARWNDLYRTGYKQILVTVDDVDAKATFFCELMD